MSKKPSCRAQAAVKPLPPTVWQALNEPVVEVSEGFAKTLIMVAVIMLSVAWLSPYWGEAKAVAAEQETMSLAHTKSALLSPEPMVAGVMVMQTAVPAWYEVVRNLPVDLPAGVAVAATEVLDISEPASRWADFYGPGLGAVKDAWLELMMDPY